MSVISDAAQPRGDVMRRLAELERQMAALRTARRLEAASVGRGGLRVQGGRVLAEDQSGDRVFEVGTEPASIFMRQELITDLAVQIFADRIFSADADAQAIISHTSFSFVSATGGPTLTDVPITSAGRAIVFATANIGTDAANPGTEIIGAMGYEVSGASSRAPAFATAVSLELQNDTDQNRMHVAASRASLLTGLNAGLHDFEAKYQVTAFGVGDEATFDFRNLTVIAF